MKEIKISVIVPVYNTSKFLEKCLNSIIEQNFKDIEIIIINDCSTDNSLEIINELIKTDSRIILINKEKNEGLSAARNSGIKIAKGEYVLHIDSDDWIEQNYFKNMYEYAKKNQADIVISDYYLDFNNGKIIYTYDQNKDIELKKENYIENIFLSKSYPCVWNKLIKTELYKKNKIKHPEGIALGEDLAVIPQLMYYSKKIIKLNKAYYHYIQNIFSITKKYNENKIYEIYEVLKINEKFFQNKKMKLSLNLLKTYHLSIWLFKVKYNFNNKKYIKVLEEYLNLLKKSEIKNIQENKLRIKNYILKYFNGKIYFFILWNVNNILTKLNKEKKC
ncbi:MAG: glycosyltransferase family 2 protein [Fusobacterium sp.]|nr:glycosyltransferase family 2 protein [Fusobacterium sp.]